MDKTQPIEITEELLAWGKAAEIEQAAKRRRQAMQGRDLRKEIQ